MPTYEYACRDCGERLEAVQSFTDEPLTSCPNCGGDLRKVFGAVGIVFKGSGFYKTDNRSNGSRSAAASETSSSPSSDKDSSSRATDSPAKPGASKNDSTVAPSTTKSDTKTTSSSTST